MCFQVGAASCFSEWEMTTVASKSSTSSAERSGAAPARQAAALALARPARKTARCSSETLSSTRQAVGSEATGPNKAGWSRSASQPRYRRRPVCDRYRQVGQHLAGEVKGQARVGADERPVPGTNEPGRGRQLSQQFTAGVGGHPGTVGRYFHPGPTGATLAHLRSAFL